MPTLFIHGEGNTGGRDIASFHWTCEVKDPANVLSARQPGVCRVAGFMSERYRAAGLA